MRLPHLDQRVPLERGEAGLLARALALRVQELTHAEQPAPAVAVLTLSPLATLGKTLLALQQREQATPPSRAPRRRKPRLVRVRYDQLVALHLHRFALPHESFGEAEQLQLQAILGKFQQQALNLTRWVRL